MAPSACDKCYADVDDSELVDVLVSKQTMSSPAEWESRCRKCLGPACDQDDIAYERSASRARGNDFARTGGKDWT